MVRHAYRYIQPKVSLQSARIILECKQENQPNQGKFLFFVTLGLGHGAGLLKATGLQNLRSNQHKFQAFPFCGTRNAMNRQHSSKPFSFRVHPFYLFTLCLIRSIESLAQLDGSHHTRSSFLSGRISCLLPRCLDHKNKIKGIHFP